MNDTHRPAEPAGDDKEGSKGFAGVARRLNDLYPRRRRPISRQLVYKWFQNRHYNRFPEPVSTAGTGTGRPVFDLQAVEKWYASYRSHHGGEPPIEQHVSPAAAPDTRPTSQNEGENPLAA